MSGGVVYGVSTVNVVYIRYLKSGKMMSRRDSDGYL